MRSLMKETKVSIYQALCATFCLLVVLSNIISAKMFQLPFFSNMSAPAGLITYPLTFLLSDLVTELYGAKQARIMVYTALALSLVSFGIIQLALLLPSRTSQEAFQATLGLSGLRIFSSLTAYLIAQLVDIQLYALIKKWTGPKFLWLRNNGSVFLSQLVDTLLIDLIYLYWGLSMSMEQVLPIMLFSYCYKAAFSIANTPLFYLSLYLLKMDWKRFFKKEIVESIRRQAEPLPVKIGPKPSRVNITLRSG